MTKIICVLYTIAYTLSAFEHLFDIHVLRYIYAVCIYLLIIHETITVMKKLNRERVPTYSSVHVL